MKTKLTILSLLFSFLLPSKSSYAQKWSAGYRTGIGMRNLNLTYEYDFKSYNLDWNNQVFLNKRMGKRFELEVSLNYNRRVYSDTFSYDRNGSFVTVASKTIINNLNPALTGRYFILQRQRLTLFAQLGISFLDPKVNYSSVESTPGSPDKYNSYNWNSFALFRWLIPGLGANYNINRQLYLNASLNIPYQGDVSQPGEQHHNEWGANLYAGVGFRF